jgi:hypothetical protein
MKYGNINTAGNISLASNTGVTYLQLPSGTGAQRPSSPLNGYIRYNTDNAIIETYTANSWSSVAVGNFLKTTGGTMTGSITLTYPAQVILANGSIAIPSLTFSNDTNTGLYSEYDGRVGFIANGNVYFTVQDPSTTNSSVIVGGSAAMTNPSGTTVQRPSVPVNGMQRYNSTSGVIEYYQSTEWHNSPLLDNNIVTTNQITGADGALSEPIMFIRDFTRGNINLSVNETIYTWSLNAVNANDFFLIASNLVATAGYVLPYAGTIVRVVMGGTSDANTKNISVYLDSVETTGALTTTTTSEKWTNTDVNIPFTAGQLLRTQARSGGTGGAGNIQDVVLNVYVRWRY